LRLSLCPAVLSHVTTHSQLVLSSFNRGDEEEEVVKEMLVQDRNERRASIQRFSDEKLKQQGMSVTVDMEEEKTVVVGAAGLAAAAAASAPVFQPANYFQDCASDDEVATLMMPARRTMGGAAAAAVAPFPAVAAAPGKTLSRCPFIIPELLAKDALTTNSAAGEIICRRCRDEVGEHRESRA
jgi:hypothetical protein